MEQRRTENMAKKIKKIKGRGSKPKGTVSTKPRETTYDIGYDAIHKRLKEDSYQQVIGNIDKSHNVQQEYLDALHNFYMSTRHLNQYLIKMQQQAASTGEKIETIIREDKKIAAIGAKQRLFKHVIK